MKSISKWAWVLFGVFALVVLVGSQLRDLWNPDEPRFAEIAHQMLARDQFVMPYLNGEIYTDKPPAYVWLIALTAKIFFHGQVNEMAARFPSLLASLFALLLTLWMGKRMFNPAAGFFALIVLATTYRFWWQATWTQLDMLLCFFILLALTCFWKIYSSVKEVPTKNKFLLLLSFYLALAGGVLTKGPIGILIPCGIIFFFLLWERRLPYLLKLWIPFGMVVLLGSVGAWVWSAYQIGGSEYLYQHFIYHNFYRYTDPGGHIRPFYYYFYQFPIDCLPWVLFLPFALWQWRRSEIQVKSPNRFLFVWFALIFIFFTLSESKRNLYLLPLFPAVALFLGEYFSYFMSHIQVQKAFKYVSIFATAVFVVSVLVSYPFINHYKSARYLCQEIKPLLKEDGACASYKFFKESFLYYIGGQNRRMEKVDTQGELEQFLKQHQDNLALVQDDDIESLKQSLSLQVLLDRRVGSHHFYVVSWKSQT